MKSRHKNYNYYFVIFAFILALSALLLYIYTKETKPELLIIKPIKLLGVWLRELSLSGMTGNTVSWAVFIIICAIPLIFPTMGLIRDKKLTSSGILCILTSAFIAFYLFLLVNPNQMSAFFLLVRLSESFNMTGSSYKDEIVFALFIILISLVSAALILYFLRMSTLKGAFTGIRVLLIIFACTGIFSIFFIHSFYLVKDLFPNTIAPNDSLNSILGDPLQNILKDIMPEKLEAAGNTPLANYFIAALRFIARSAPALVYLSVVDPVIKLLHNMKENFFDRAHLNMIYLIIRRIRISIILFVCCSVGFNLVQLFFAAYALNITLRAEFPVVDLLFAFIMMFFARYVAESIKLHEENQQYV